MCRCNCLEAGVACVRLCTFAGRIEYVWLVEFRFDATGRLVRCRVAPSFPSKGQTISSNILCPLRHVDDPSNGNLIDLLPAAPTPGFQQLVRYVDTLAIIHHLPVAPLELLREDGTLVDVSCASILAHGHHSVVLLPSASSQFVVKISRSDLIDRERRIHALVDRDGQSLRRLVEGGWGKVNGVGAGLGFVQLAGVGEPLTAAHVTDPASLILFWEQASQGLAALHAKHILHRDVKPSNMVIIHGELVLNDFDVACTLEDKSQLEKLDVGTDIYRSPKLSNKWRQRDDWLGLALSFLSLRLPFPFVDKQLMLDRALQLDWVPDAMKAKIRDAYNNR